MQIKVNNKYILLCLLICFLFLSSISVLHTNGIISSDMNVFDIFFAHAGSEHSSMNGGANIGHDDYMAATDTSAELSIFSMRQSRWLGTKINFNILTAIVAALVTCFIYYLRLSDETYTQSNSIIITIFLHKKDGMK